MPTGYTAAVEDGTITDLRTFVLQCARAFGPCVMQKDDPTNDLPVKREPTTYHLERLEVATKECRKLAKMTPEQAEKEAMKEYRAAMRDYKQTLKRHKEEIARYESMLAKVRLWTPPTADHEGLQNFMIQQLTDSMRHNYEPRQPEKLTAKAWLKKAKEDNQWELDYFTKKHNEELKRCEDSNRWIEALYQGQYE